MRSLYLFIFWWMKGFAVQKKTSEWDQIRWRPNFQELLQQNGSNEDDENIAEDLAVNYETRYIIINKEELYKVIKKTRIGVIQVLPARRKEKERPKITTISVYEIKHITQKKQMRLLHTYCGK